MKIEQKSDLKKIYMVFNKLEFTLFLCIFGKFKAPFLLVVQSDVELHHPPNFFQPFPPFHLPLLPLIVTIVIFFFVALFLGRGAGLRISCKSKSFSTCENECFNPA
jgi:hypothetical protein